jgi:hypothetical protein
MSYRIHRLCTDPDDIKKKVKQLYNRLRVRGYKPSDLKPLFQRAAEKALQHNIPSTPQATPDEPVIFFHVQYHPNGPSSRDIQQTWRDTISEPPQCRTLASYATHNGPPIELRRMIVCYNRAKNLGNLLSYWKINTSTGPPVSSYRITNNEGPREREREREFERESSRERVRERESKYAESISTHIFILPQYPTTDTINTRKYALTSTSKPFPHTASSTADEATAKFIILNSVQTYHLIVF